MAAHLRSVGKDVINHPNVRLFAPSQAFAPPPGEGWLYSPPYMQDTDRGGFGGFTLFDESALPGQAQIRTPQAWSMQGGLATNIVTLNGVNYWMADHPQTSASLFAPYNYHITQGRDKPYEHCVSTHNTEAYGADATTGVSFGDGFFARRVELCSMLFMFAPRVNAQIEVGGVYCGFRTIQGNPNAAISYSTPMLPFSVSGGGNLFILLPEFAIMESGTYNQQTSTYVPQRQKIIAGRGFTMRSGLGRQDVLSPEGTMFCANAYTPYGSVCSVAFGYSPPSIDNTVVMLSRWEPTSTLALYIHTLSRGFVASWPAALWLRMPDHAKIGRIAYFGSALAYPAWQGSALQSPDWLEKFYWPRNPAWGTWNDSRYPYTLRGCVDGLRPSGASIPSTGGAASPPMPIYGYQSYTDVGPHPGTTLTVFQPHPARTVQAKCVELDVNPRHTHFDEKAAFLFGQQNDFVFGGKKITKLSVSFSPYLEQQTSIPNGSFEQLTPPTSPPFPLGVPFNLDDPALAVDRRVGVGYWKANGIVAVPPGPNNYGIIGTLGTGAQKEVSFFYSGTRSLLVDAQDGGMLTSQHPVGNVSESTESTALLSLERSLLGVPTEPDTNPAAFYKNAPSSKAPPTGEYDLEPFSMNGIEAAPGVFCYAGPGDFSASQSFTISRVVRYGGPSSWKFIGVVGGRNQYQVEETTERATIATTLDVSLNADHVEFYAVLGSRLQEGGQYVVPPIFTQGSGETFEQFQERQRAYTHDVWDQPKGKFRDQVVYIDGQEPHAVLTLSLFGRTVLRSEAQASADYSSIPGYGGSFQTGGNIEPYSSAVVGGGGIGYDGNASVLVRHHGYGKLDYTFSRAQTLQLFGGQPVDLTRWSGDQQFANLPVLMDFGVPYFKYRVQVTATVEDV